MWELLTRGLTPYPTVSNFEIANHVKNGGRLEQPDYCPDVMSVSDLTDLFTSNRCSLNSHHYRDSLRPQYHIVWV